MENITRVVEMRNYFLVSDENLHVGDHLETQVQLAK